MLHHQGTLLPPPVWQWALPLPLTSFVGREVDVRAVRDALGRARLVTLTGPGGAGKTRLALEALRREGEHHPAGHWVVELGYVQPGGVVAGVAHALEVASSQAPTAQVVADAVRGRRLLLVLDNCEHLADEVAALVAHLLRTCGGLQVLATSRQPLGVPGEQVHVVAPLRLGLPGSPGEAERLFAERAGSVVPGFTLDASTAATVTKLVRSLDGIPLAVELAAARLSMMGLDDIVAMLDDRFDLLEGGSRTALPHQQTLAAAVEWSYDLLDPQERLLFGVASTFAGPFQLAALRAVAEPELDRPVIGLLASLTAKSMVQVDRGTDLRRSRSYRLLETMRAYGRQRLDAAVRDRVAARHAAWLATESGQAYLGLRGPETKRWLQHLDLVRPDMRAALTHAVDRGDRATGLRLVAGLSTYWFHRGQVPEAMGWMGKVAALPGSADDVWEARAALGVALLAYVSGSAVSLEGGLLEGLRRAAGVQADPSTAAIASVYAGYFEAAFGDVTRAEDHFRCAEELLEAGLLEQWAVAEVRFTRAQLLRAQGQPLEALRMLTRSVHAAQECGHAWARGSARYIAAKVYIDLRQGDQALRLLAEELPSCLHLGIHTSTLALLHAASAATALLERHEEAAVLLGAVDALGERLGYAPARMDPLDAAAHRRLVREGLNQAGFVAAKRRGRELTMGRAVEAVTRLAEGTRGGPRPLSPGAARRR